MNEEDNTKHREATIRSLSEKLAAFSESLGPPERELLRRVMIAAGPQQEQDVQGFEYSDPYMETFSWCGSSMNWGEYDWYSE